MFDKLLLRLFPSRDQHDLRAGDAKWVRSVERAFLALGPIYLFAYFYIAPLAEHDRQLNVVTMAIFYLLCLFSCVTTAFVLPVLSFIAIKLTGNNVRFATVIQNVLPYSIIYSVAYLIPAYHSFRICHVVGIWVIVNLGFIYRQVFGLKGWYVALISLIEVVLVILL